MEMAAKQLKKQCGWRLFCLWWKGYLRESHRTWCYELPCLGLVVRSQLVRMVFDLYGRGRPGMMDKETIVLLCAYLMYHMRQQQPGGNVTPTVVVC